MIKVCYFTNIQFILLLRKMIFIYIVYVICYMVKGGKSKCNINEKSNTNDYVPEETTKSHPPLIAKWRNGVKLQLPGKFDGEGKLYLNT